MEYFLLSTTGELNDPDLCIIDSAPEDIGLYDYCLSRGVRAAEHYPDDAKVFLQDSQPGIKLAGLIGNTLGYLILSTNGMRLIEEFCPDSEIEYLQFTLFNHKKRVHSSDYWFVNPIGGFDCLDEKASGVELDEDGEAEAIEEFVLAGEKLKDAPHLFRISLDPGEYVISRELGEAFAKSNVTNVQGQKLKIAPS
ncbi:MAG: hypothetical protein R3C53_26965 [Pirellulaceae bacterium]